MFVKSVQKRRSERAHHIAAHLGVQYVNLALAVHVDPHRILLDTGARGLVATGGGLSGITVLTRHAPEAMVRSVTGAMDALDLAEARGRRVSQAVSLVTRALGSRGIRVHVVDDLDMQGCMFEDRPCTSPRPPEGHQAVLITGFPSIMHLFLTSFAEERIKPDPGLTLAVVLRGQSYMAVTSFTDAAAVHRFIDTWP